MSNIKGFSLVELMVAVGIIGAMTAMAVPNYQKYKVNATRAEAQSSLSSMYTLQQLYFTENDKFATTAVTYSNGVPTAADVSSAVKNPVGFSFTPDQKYKYATEASGTNNLLFKATAISDKKLGSCATVTNDKWCINHDKVLTNDSQTGGKDAALFTATGSNPAPAAPCIAGEAVNGGC